MAIQARNVSASVDARPGSPATLTVSGEANVSAGNQVPVLGEAEPQGINPKILILNLSQASTGGIGTQAFEWKDMSFSREVDPADQFSSVSIMSGGEEVASAEVVIRV